jgi:ankyrin repeat protein
MSSEALVENNDVDALRAWLDAHRDAAVDLSHLRSLIILAVSHNRIECAEALLDRLSQSDLEADFFLPYMVYMAAAQDDERLLELLISRGADLQRPEINSFNLYQIAASNSNDKVLAALLRARAPLADLDQCEVHPIMCAARNRNEAVLTLLIDAGAAASVLDLQAALEAAVGNANERVFQLLADRCARGQFADSVCFAAAANRNPSAMRRLLAEGVDVNCRRATDRASLCHVAAAHGHRETLSYLLAAGADFNALDRDGKSPCALAASAGHRDAVELLLRSGADLPGAIDAVLHVELFELLLAAGADWRSRVDAAVFDWCLFDVVDERVVEFVLASDVCAQHRQAQLELAVQLGRVDALRRLRRDAANVDYGRLVLVAAMCDAPLALQRARQRTRVTWAANARARRATKAQLLGALFACGVRFDWCDANWLAYICADSAFQIEAFATVVASGMQLETVCALVSQRAVGAPFLAALGCGTDKPHADEKIAGALRLVAKCQLALLRQRGFEIAVGLHALEMSALQMCEILSYAFAPLKSIVPFHKVWAIVTKIKHFAK